MTRSRLRAKEKNQTGRQRHSLRVKVDEGYGCVQGTDKLLLHCSLFLLLGSCSGAGISDLAIHPSLLSAMQGGNQGRALLVSVLFFSASSWAHRR
jgi:hypothetical protein